MADEVLKRDADRNTVSGGVTNNAALEIVMLRVDPTTKRLLVDSNVTDITSIIPGVGATNLGKAEDAVHSSGDVGVMALAVRNDDLTPLAADGDYHPLTIDGHAGLHTAPEHVITLDELAATAGWTVLGTDTTGLTTNADHISGTASVEFDKVDGAAGTVFAGIQKTLTSADLSLFHIHESIHLAINISLLTNVDYVFVRLGTDSSHYNEWRVEDDDLTTGWQVLKMVIGNASTAGSTGNGWNPAAVTYAAVGVAFDDEADELLNIRVNHLSLHSGLHTTSDITSEVSTAVNSPNIRLIGYGGSISTNAGNAGSGTLRVILASDQNFVHLEDVAHSTGDAGIMALAVRQDTHSDLAADGDYIPLTVDADGGLRVTAIGWLQMQGNVAHDEADSGSPVKIGGKAQTHLAAPDEVADNDRVNTLFDRVGRMAVYQGYVVKSAPINDSTSGDNTIVAAVATKRIRVLAVTIVSDGTTDVRWESGAGGTALTGQIPLQAREGYTISNPWGLFETAAVNTLLNLELTAAVNVHGWVTYIEVDD